MNIEDRIANKIASDGYGFQEDQGPGFLNEASEERGPISLERLRQEGTKSSEPMTEEELKIGDTGYRFLTEAESEEWAKVQANFGHGGGQLAGPPIKRQQVQMTEPRVEEKKILVGPSLTHSMLPGPYYDMDQVERNSLTTAEDKKVKEIKEIMYTYQNSAFQESGLVFTSNGDSHQVQVQLGGTENWEMPSIKTDNINKARQFWKQWDEKIKKDGYKLKKKQERTYSAEKHGMKPPAWKIMASESTEDNEMENPIATDDKDISDMAEKISQETMKQFKANCPGEERGDMQQWEDSMEDDEMMATDQGDIDDWSNDLKDEEMEIVTATDDSDLEQMYQEQLKKDTAEAGRGMLAAKITDFNTVFEKMASLEEEIDKLMQQPMAEKATAALMKAYKSFRDTHKNLTAALNDHLDGKYDKKNFAVKAAVLTERIADSFIKKERKE